MNVLEKLEFRLRALFESCAVMLVDQSRFMLNAVYEAGHLIATR